MSRPASRRLKYLVRINQRSLAEDTDPDYEFRYLNISAVGRGTLVSEPATIRFSDAPSRARRLVRPGDTIVSTVRTYLRAVWPVRGRTAELVVSTGFAVISPGPELDARYFGWLAQSDPFIEEIVARSVGVGYPAINATDIGELVVPVPALTEQRNMADFLDRETARIDALIAAKKKMGELSREREASILSGTLVPTGVAFARLGFLARLQTGLTVDGARDSGPNALSLPYLRVANVQADRLDLSAIAEISVAADLAARSTLRLGDVLLTEGGDLDKLGRGTVWRGELSNCLHQNHIFAVRPHSERLDPEYLALLTRTAHARQYFESTGTKTTNLASTNSTKILGLPVPALAIEEQRRLVQMAESLTRPTHKLRLLLGKQIELLEEHRRALITAVVTGEISVAGVAA